MKIILASNSPRRKELLHRIISEFTIIPANIDETLPEDIGPEFAPVFLSAQKAQEVAEKFHDYFVIGADTVVVLDNEIIGKPKDKNDAINILKRLSGKSHFVITGVCLAYKGEIETFSVNTEVTFFKLSDQEIIEYVNTSKPLDKAGAYGIQDDGCFFVEKIDGDYNNVIGLPISTLKRKINEFISGIDK